MSELDLILQISRKLFSAEKVLIMTHRRPDGDALGSTFGLRNCLRSHGIAAEVLLPDGIPPRYSSLCDGYLTAVSDEELAGFDLFAALDCANSERLGTGENFSVETLRQRNFISIDHHKGNSLNAPLEWIDPSACSASFMTASLLLKSSREFDRSSATMFMTGIMTDTGSFCFDNTDAAAFQVAAELMVRGAEVGRIANAIFFSKPLHQLRFEAELIETRFRFSCDGRFAYAFVPEELMKKHNFDMREDEGLIDLLRGIDGVVIAMLSHRRPDGFRISFRSKDPAFPVGPLARKLGGGGHDMAAGATVQATDFSEVEKMICAEIGQLLG